MKSQVNVLTLSIFLVIFIFLGIDSLAQPYDPLSLHFRNDYQLRNFYNSSITVSELELSGTLAFNKGDGLLRQWSASDVFFDRNDTTWKVFTVSHRDDHTLYSAAFTEDPRCGFREISGTIVDYESVGNEEDPSVIYDPEAGKWRMAIFTGIMPRNLRRAFMNILNKVFIPTQSKHP